jgi:hypothetical protein
LVEQPRRQRRKQATAGPSAIENQTNSQLSEVNLGSSTSLSQFREGSGVDGCGIYFFGILSLFQTLMY